jgi:GNAT superfamily N-acetyltransferase
MISQVEEGSPACNRQMVLDDYSIFLEFNEGTCQLHDDDPSYYAYSTHGSIVAVDERDEKTTVGRFKLYYIDVCAAINARASVFDVFDSRASTLDYFGAIFDYGTLNFSERLLRLFEPDFRGSWGNILILDRLEILPEFRHQNVGLLIMRRLIERFGAGAAVVAIKPFPLQCEYRRKGDVDDEWTRGLQLTDFDKDNRRATAKLKRYYAKLGFKAMKGTPFMFLLTDCPLPEPDDLMKQVAPK